MWVWSYFGFLGRVLNKLFSKNRYKFIPLLTTSDDDGHRINRLRSTYCILVNASKGLHLWIIATHWCCLEWIGTLVCLLCREWLFSVREGFQLQMRLLLKFLNMYNVSSLTTSVTPNTPCLGHCLKNTFESQII